jgi:hypothetical protein
MKKITLLISAILITFSFYNSEAQIVLTQNTDQVFVPGGVSCGGGDNQWYRQYVLPGEAIPYTNAIIVGAEFGIEAIDGPEDLTVSVYLGSPGFPSGFPGSYTLLDQTVVTVDLADAGNKVIVSFTGGATVDTSVDTIVVEINQPTVSGNGVFLGVTAEETQPNWIASTECGVTTPTVMDAIGFPDAHHMINLVVDESLSVGDQLSEVSSIYPNPMTDVLNIKVPANVEITKATLYDILGKDTGIKASNATMNTAGLTAGIYMLKVETSAGTFTQKVIKQ